MQHTGIVRSTPRTLSDSPGAACLVSSADRCSVSSVRACVSVCGLLWAVCLASGTPCAAACAVQPVRVRWGLGSPPLGYMERARGRVVYSSHRKNSKKAFFGVPSPHLPHPHKTKRLSLCKSPKIPKNTKRPLSRFNLCYT